MSLRGGAEVVLLSDCTGYGGMIFSRYAGPYALAARLREAGFSVAVVDYFTRHPDLFSYLSGFVGERTLLVGISSTFLSAGLGAMQAPLTRTARLQSFRSNLLWHGDREASRSWLRDLRRAMAALNPRCRLALGGAKADQVHRDPAAFAGLLDYVVLGPADRALVELAGCLRRGVEPARAAREGVAFLAEDDRAPRCPPMDMRQADAVQPGESLPVEISRGCVYDCKFCYYDRKQSVRKDLAVLREELLRNHERFGTTVYHFCDDCFNDTPEKVQAVCGMLRELPFEVEWITYVRPDVHVKRPELLDLMIEAGCRGLYYGVETFNHAAGKAAGKGVPPEQAKRFFAQAAQRHRHRALFAASFIVGLPHETAASQRETVRWLVENKVFDFVQFGALAHRPYDEALERLTIDHADHVKNPARYGFQVVPKAGSFYWRHETMDEPQAAALLQEARAALEAAYGAPVLGSCFLYPAIRTLGFSAAEALRMAREGSAERSLAWRAEVDRRTALWLERYWAALAAAWSAEALS